MKTKDFAWIMLLMVVFGFQSCKEVIPDFPKNAKAEAGDTTYVESPAQSASLRKVLMEEFTGVQCVNCPQGHQIIKNVEQTFPDRIVAVGMHSLFLNRPYSFSLINTNNADAELLSAYLGDPGFKPAASIDRSFFDATSSSYQSDRANWQSQAQSRISVSSHVNIEIANSYNNSTRELTSILSTHFTEADAAKTKITVVLIEDSIITAQANASLIDTYYVHRNTVRAFLSPYDGKVLGEQNEAGRVYVKVFKTTLPTTWDADKCKVAAYVHYFEGSKDVLQAEEAKLK